MNITQPVAKLLKAEASRGPGYLAACIERGQVSPDGLRISFAEADYYELRRLFNPNGTPGESLAEVRRPVPPHNPKRDRPEDEQAEIVNTICPACENYKAPHCCRLVSGCAGGLKNIVRFHMSRCPMEPPKWGMSKKFLNPAPVISGIG